MSIIAALDFATRHRLIADRIMEDCDDYGRGELALNLLRLYSHSAKRLRSDLGRVALYAHLHRIGERDEDWGQRTAAKLILSYDEMSDPGVDTALRDFGYHTLEQLVHTVNVCDRVFEVITAIVTVWRRLLPELNTALLEHFADELAEEEKHD